MDIDADEGNADDDLADGQDRRVDKVSPLRLSDFDNFVAQAQPLVVQGLRQTLGRLTAPLEAIRPWLVEEQLDLLSSAGLSYVEDAYTELMAWALRPSTHPQTSLRRQLAWLSVLNGSAIRPTRAVEPQTQFWTDNGIPDLVLYYPNELLVVVEAKTGTDEHEVPEGDSQTKSYAMSVRRKLGLHDTFPTLTVFVTPDGRDPENTEAVSTTFSHFVLALAKELPPKELPDSVRWSFSLLFTHLLTNAVPDEVDRSAIRSVMTLVDSNSWKTEDASVLGHLRVIRDAASVLPSESRHEQV